MDILLALKVTVGLCLLIGVFCPTLSDKWFPWFHVASALLLGAVGVVHFMSSGKGKRRTDYAQAEEEDEKPQGRRKKRRQKAVDAGRHVVSRDVRFFKLDEDATQSAVTKTTGKAAAKAEGKPEVVKEAEADNDIGVLLQRSVSSGGVEGLDQVITSLGLEARAGDITQWCRQMGAAYLNEVAEEVEDLCTSAKLNDQQSQKMKAWAAGLLQAEDDSQKPSTSQPVRSMSRPLTSQPVRAISRQVTFHRVDEKPKCFRVVSRQEAPLGPLTKFATTGPGLQGTAAQVPLGRHLSAPAGPATEDTPTVDRSKWQKAFAKIRLVTSTLANRLPSIRADRDTSREEAPAASGLKPTLSRAASSLLTGLQRTFSSKKGPVRQLSKKTQQGLQAVC